MFQTTNQITISLGFGGSEALHESAWVWSHPPPAAPGRRRPRSGAARRRRSAAMCRNVGFWMVILEDDFGDLEDDLDDFGEMLDDFGDDIY